MTEPIKRELPEPHFVDRDPDQITREAIALFEEKAGRPLEPAQVERIQIDVAAYRETLVRIALQEAAKQNLLYYSGYPMIDYLGQPVGVERLEEAASRTTMRFTLAAVREADFVIPKNTRIRTKDGVLFFGTEADLAIPAGSLTGDVVAVCATVGEVGNGYLPGDVNDLVDVILEVESVENTTTSTGGADTEQDTPYRERIRKAPHKFSVGGPREAYRERAKDAHQDIVDVEPVRPQKGDVDVYILTVNGAPSQEIKDLVAASLGDEKFRPIGDNVTVKDAVVWQFAIHARLTLYTGSDAATVQAQAEAALAKMKSEWDRRLGLDVVLKQIESPLIAIPGVYDVELAQPLAGRTLEKYEWAQCTGITVEIVGFADG